MRSGDALYLWSQRLNKDKYVIVVDPSAGLFLTVNTDPPYAPGAGVEVLAHENRFVRYDSWIDTSRLILIPVASVEGQLAKDPTRHLGRIRDALRDQIKECVAGHGILPAWQENLVNRM